jgi:type I restriction enzyme S subunit
MSVECSAGNIPPGYKQTEVGVIPEDWEAKSMDEIGQVIRGASPRPKGDKRFYGGNIPRLMVEDITRDKHWIKPSIDYLTDEGAKQSRLCKKGTLTVICSGTPSAVGLPALLAVDACIHDGILGLVQIEKDISAEFLFHQLGSLQQRLHAAATHGGTFVNLTTEALRAFKIALPPTKAEQKSIAEALSDTDALIESLEQLIAKKSQIKQGAMQELLTGKRRLLEFEIKKGQKQTEMGEIPKDWDIVTLENATLNGGLVRGPFGGTLKKEIFVESGYKVYEQRNAIYRTVEMGNYFIDSNKYKELERFSVHPGDLIVSCSGTIGCIYQIPIGSPDGVINQALLKISLNKEIVDNTFFLAVFQSKSFQERIKENSHGGAMQNLVGMDVFRNTTFQLPSKDEQEAIATILSDMDLEITALEEKLAKARQIKQGMMQELLTGRVRLI